MYVRTQDQPSKLERVIAQGWPVLKHELMARADEVAREREVWEAAHPIEPRMEEETR